MNFPKTVSKPTDQKRLTILKLAKNINRNSIMKYLYFQFFLMYNYYISKIKAIWQNLGKNLQKMYHLRKFQKNPPKMLEKPS